MFNTMRLVKIIGGFGGALLAYLLIHMVSGALYATGGGEGEEQVQAYVVETDDGGSAAGEEQATQEAEPDFAAILAEADAEKGAKVFGKCKACHKLEKGANATGPYLFGVVGRPVATAEGFKYSDALKSLGGNWEPERLNIFLTKPKDYAPGTKMSFAGLKKITDRANLIAYLSTIGE